MQTMKTKVTYVEKLPRPTLKEVSINSGYDCLLKSFSL